MSFVENLWCIFELHFSVLQFLFRWIVCNGCPRDPVVSILRQ